jgi:hypothetical protein
LFLLAAKFFLDELSRLVFGDKFEMGNS